MQKGITERSIYTTEIIKLLEKVSEGEMITYKEISNEVGIGVEHGQAGYGYQKSARDILEREQDIVFDVITGKGLKRLTPAQIGMGSGNIYIKRKKSLIKKSSRRISTLNDKFDELGKDVQLKVTAHRTLLAFDSELLKKKNITMIENRVNDTKKLIGFDDTIKMFTPKKPIENEIA